MTKIIDTTLRIGIWLLVLTCACGLRPARPAQTGQPPSLNVSAQNAPLVYVALGDSTGVGVGAHNGGYVERLMKRLERLRPSSTLVNLCEAGATTSQVLDKQLPRALKAKGGVMTLGVGINDLARGVSEQEFAQNFERIVSQLKQAGAPVVLMNLPDLSAFPAAAGLGGDEVEVRVERFNQQIANIAARYQLPLFDLHQFSREIIHAHPEFISDDGFHPSDAGYEYWTEALWPVVEKTLTTTSQG